MPPPAPVPNFGRNVVSRPRAVEAPRSEVEVLALLSRHRGRKLRAVGSLHSWSEAARADDVLVDLRHLDGVRVERDAEGPLARVGAGCRLARVHEAAGARGLALPTTGLIAEQTVAGATATGTHGSGRSSLSHYLLEVRVAHYDPETGEPAIRVLREGDELRAARCALGCLGIVVEVALRLREAYAVEEWLEARPALEDALAAEAETPLQQFYLVPWRWDYVLQRRREAAPRPRGLRARLYRLYWLVAIDVGLVLSVLVATRVLRSARAVKGFYRHVAERTVVRGLHVVDDSAAMLVMRHELFRHVEIEVFVLRSRLAEAVALVRALVEHCAGEPDALQPSLRERLRGLGLEPELEALAGTYVHHYAITLRLVHPDDTLISMTAGDAEPRYAISLISYERGARLDAFLRFAAVVARAGAALVGARPHWGKVCPLDAATLEALHPGLPAFRDVCRRLDPDARFANAWAERVVLGRGPDA